MAQNTSSAVMQQRQEPRDSLEDFPTPPWATRALCEWMRGEFSHLDLSEMAVREPTANRGHMARTLQESFGHVEASDIHDYGAGYPIKDYLFGPEPEPTDFTITNPPFRLAEPFIKRALNSSTQGVAMFVRNAFLESVGRYERLFQFMPPTQILQFSERVVIHKGRLSHKGSTATAYCWMVWNLSRMSSPYKPEFLWIPPCRKRLERPEDYHPRPKDNWRSIGEISAGVVESALSERAG